MQARRLDTVSDLCGLYDAVCIARAAARRGRRREGNAATFRAASETLAILAKQLAPPVRARIRELKRRGIERHMRALWDNNAQALSFRIIDPRKELPRALLEP